MTGAHPELGPELRKLAQTILDGIDPAVRLAAAKASAVGAGAGKCQQVWCPVCALAALVSGEQHPLLSAVAEHSVAMVTVVRKLVDDINRSAPPPPDGPPSGGGAAEPAGNGAGRRYQPITITVDE